MNSLVSWPRRQPPGDPTVPDEAVASPSRLAAVVRSGLLDSSAEPSFDALTALAARLVRAPASFISIVDAQRDFYKSQSGFGEALAAEREMCGRTFCHYTLQSDEPLVIDDTHSDPVWQSVPTVSSIGVRSYVGVPLSVDGERIGSFCVIDTQPRVWSAEELEIVRQLAISAARELALRAALDTSKAALVVAQEMARAREEVIAVIAHDLRTPLQVIKLSAMVVQKGAAGGHESSFTRMFAALDALKSMADGLLSENAMLASSAGGRLVIEGATLLADAVDMMMPIAERMAIHLQLGAVPAALVTVDYAQLLRVMGNLIGNSLKYSAPGSAITVSGRREADVLHLTVTDKGMGMDDAEQARAFERGWQGGAGMERGDGAGLGLSIVKRLVEQHGGTLTLSSALGEGTSVTFSLPCL